MNERKIEFEADYESDPAHTPGAGWADEGGASHLGPATHLEAGHGHPEAEDDPENDHRVGTEAEH